MEWYERLNDYFPEHEMKNPQQLKELIEENEVYHKEETDNYILLYAEFQTFIFIDYLLVTSNSRGKGIGTKVLDKLKEKDKLILLEAEPRSSDNPDSHKRLAFYSKNGFKKAELIEYTRVDKENNPYKMHILYWSPSGMPQSIVLENMEKICEDIHNFKAKKYYGKLVADPDKALEWRQ